MEILKKIKGNISLITLILVFSPFIDVFISMLIRNYPGLSFVGSAIRGLLLCIVLFIVFFGKQGNNKKINNIILCLLAFVFVYVANEFVFSRELLKTEIIGIVKFFFFPLVLLSLIQINKENNTNAFYISSLLYVLFLIIPLLTNSSLPTYDYVKAGKIGWYFSPNEISAILGILSPFVVLKVIDNNKTIWKILATTIACIYIFMLFTIGTKVPVFAIYITIAFFLCLSLLQFTFDKKNRKNKAANILYVLIISMFTAFMTLNGSLTENVMKQGEVFENITQEQVNKEPDSLITTTPESTSPSDGQSSENNSSTPSYSVFNNEYNLTEKYLDNTNIVNTPTEEYQTNKFLNLIFSSRDVYLARKYSYWKTTPIVEKLFGIGISSRENDLINKTIEIDIFDILFNYGIIGFILYYGIIIIILVLLIKHLFENFKQTILDSSTSTLYCSFGIFILISCIAGHVLGAPAVSLIGAIIISNIITKAKKIELKHNKFFSKNNILTICCSIVGFVIILITALCIDNIGNDKIELSYNNEQFIIESKKYELVLVDQKTLEGTFATDEIFSYQVRKSDQVIMNLVSVIRSFDNNTEFYYLTGKNVANNSYEITLVDSFDNEKIQQEKNGITFYSKETKKQYIYADTHIYSIQKTNYGSNSSKVKQLKTTSKTKSETETLEQVFNLKKDECFDALKIVTSKQKAKKNTGIDFILNSDYSEWLTLDGTYARSSENIEPNIKEGYIKTLNISSAINNKIKDDVLYESFIRTQLQILENYTIRFGNDKMKLWLNNYTDMYKKEIYGVNSPHYSIDIQFQILELLEYYEENFGNNKKITEWKAYFANYIINEYKNGMNVELRNGSLIPESKVLGNKTIKETKLYNQVRVINYLLNLYEDTKNSSYKEIAIDYYKTLDKISINWIKENGNLYTLVNNYEIYSGDDTSDLILDELLELKENIKENSRLKVKNIDKLIKSKVQYLQVNDYEFNPLIADNLKEGGYLE